MKRKLKVAGYLVCVLAMGIALGTRYNSDSTILVDSYGLATQLITIIAAYIFWKLSFDKGFLPDISRNSLWTIVCTAVLALVLFIYRPIDEGGMLWYQAITFPEGIKLDTTRSFIYWSIMLLIGDCCLCWAITCLAFAGIKKIGQAFNQAGEREEEKPISGRIIVLVLLIAWLPYLIVWFPGTLTTDQSHQIAQMIGYGGLELTDQYPFLVGLVYLSLYRLGLLFDPSGWSGILLMTLLQLAVALLVFYEVVRWIQIASRSRRVTMLALAFFALFPLIPVYIVSIGKDGLHAMLVTLLCLQVYLFVKDQRASLPSGKIYSSAAIALNCVFVSLTRSNGIFLAVFALIAAYIATKSRKVIITLLTLCTAFVAWTMVIVPACGVKNNGVTEALSLPLQVVSANLRAGSELDDNSRNVLDRSFSENLDVVADLYTPTIADPTKRLLVVGKEGSATTAEFCSVALRLCIQHPLTSITGALKTTMSLYPFTLGTFWHEDSPYYSLPSETWALSGWFDSSDEIGERSEAPLVEPSVVFLKGVHETLPLSILYTPGTYFWIIVCIVGFVLNERHFREVSTGAIMASIMPLILLEGVLFAAPCGSVRYALPLVYCVPIYLLYMKDLGVGDDLGCAGESSETAK